jgi:hypothetical protein
MFRDIEQGTENFSQANYLGDGAYGQSYRARMEVSGRRTTNLGGKEEIKPSVTTALVNAF